jgi:DNA-binding response OmpR family regulator
VTTILIAEDEARITSFLEKGLRANGFSTEVATDGEEALRLARSGRFALLILDLGLPGKDGIDVLRQLRAEGRPLPVVILTARHSVDDKVVGLDGGANDYVTKPFRFDELLARIRVRLREERSAEPAVLHVGDLALDLGTRHVIVGGRSVQLSAREFDLAHVFFRRPGQVLTRAELLSEVWGYDFDPGSNIIDVYVGYLRRKLGRDRITSVRRVGYRLEPHPPSSSGAKDSGSARRLLA